MEWLKSYCNESGIKWEFLSTEGCKLHIYNKLSFAIIYADCELTGLKSNPSQITDCSDFDFSKSGNVTFLCKTESDSGQLRSYRERCDVVSFEVRCVYTDYTARFCLAVHYGYENTYPTHLCLEAANVLIYKNDVTDGEALTPKEEELLPYAYALKFLISAPGGTVFSVYEKHRDAILPILDDFPDTDYVKKITELTKKPDKKTEKMLYKQFRNAADSYNGHVFFSNIMHLFSDATSDFLNVKGRKARRQITDDLHGMGYTGSYPYFRKMTGGTFRYVAFAEYTRIKDGEEKLRALLRCAAMMESRDGTAYGIPFEESFIYDTAFVAEGKNISLETLDMEETDGTMRNETLVTAEKLFDNQKIPRNYAKSHKHLRASYRRSFFQAAWISILVFLTSGALVSAVLTTLIAGIATGIAAIKGIVTNDSGYLSWYIWARGSWLDVAIPIAVIAGVVCTKILRSSMTKPLKIKVKKKKSK